MDGQLKNEQIEGVKRLFWIVGLLTASAFVFFLACWGFIRLLITLGFD